MFFSKKNKPQPEKLEINTPNVEGEPTPQPNVPKYNADDVLGGLQWYRLGFHRAMKAVFWLGTSLTIAILFIIFLVTSQPSPKYFASSADGQIIPMTPLDQPLLSQGALLNWVAETITKTLSLDFLHWREKLTDARSNFTPEAFKSFVASMKGAGVLTMIEEKRLSISTVVSQAPVIIASGVLEGRMTWKIECPVLLSYESSKGVESTQKLLATILVRREPTSSNARGLAITQIVLARHVK